MFLAKWLKQRRHRPPSPISTEVEKVNKQAEELRRLVSQLRTGHERHTP